MSFTVKAQTGDTLETIARRTFGTEQAAGLIARANPGLVLPIRAGVDIVVPMQPAGVAVSVSEPDEVGITISGERFRFWSRMSITRGIDEISTAQFDAPFEPENAAFRANFKPFSYQPITVQIGGEVLQIGTMMGTNPNMAEASSTVAVTCYGAPGVLGDCTPPASDFPIQFDGMDLREIARSLCEPFGIGVVLEGDPGAPFDRVDLNAGTAILPFLAGLSEQRGRVIRDDVAGRLVLATVTPGGRPVAQLKQGQAPLVGVTSAFNPQTYYSHLTGLETQIIGIGAGSFTVPNKRLLGAFRPYSFIVPDSFEAGVAVATEEKAARMFAEAAAWSAQVATWRAPDGRLWEPGQIVELEAPRAMIYASYKFMIRRVTLSATENARTATLELIVPEAFAGVIPEAMPWD